VLQLVDVGKRYGHKLLFEGIGWHVRRGERIGLVGPNGCGKTTLLTIMAGRLETDSGSVVVTRGVTVGLLDQEHQFTPGRTVLQEVQRASDVLQDLQTELADLEGRLDTASPATLERYGELQNQFETLGGYRAETEARRMLCGLGFTDAELHDTATRFSGGWRMRIALARLLMTRPDVLLLDEPTNHLDLESIAWLEGELSMWEGAIVTVSHDRYYLNRACKHVAELTPAGVVVYTGNYDEFLTQREERRALIEKQAAQQAKEIAATEKFIERFRYKASKAAAVQSRVKSLAKVKRIAPMQSTRGMRGFNFPQPGRCGRFVVELEGVGKAWDDNVVYEGLDLRIERGWRVALIGVNGAGKSTLLKVLADTTEIQAGERRLGHNVNVGYFGQHQTEALNPELTVMQEVEAVANMDTYPLVRSILGAFLFSGADADKPIGVLSGGEKSRVALARMLLEPVALMLMDEPTSHLDLESRESLEDALCRYTGTLVVVSHDRYFINSVCTHVLEVSKGETRWYPGNYDEYLWKKAQEAQADAAPTDQPIQKKTSGGLVDRAAQVDRPSDDSRSRKRAEAEARQRISAATRTLKKELDSIQAAIEVTEARLAEIDELLADPGAYQAGGKGVTLGLERAEVSTRLAAEYELWESLELQIEEATEKARLG
jgi:ATP-binding cassette subfamily F protein 3